MSPYNKWSMSPRRRKRDYRISDYANTFASIATIDLLSDSEDNGNAYKRSSACIELIENDDDTDDRKPASIRTKTCVRQHFTPSNQEKDIIELIDDNDDDNGKQTAITTKCPSSVNIEIQKFMSLVDCNDGNGNPTAPATTSVIPDLACDKTLQHQCIARRVLALQADEALAKKLQKQEEEERAKCVKAKSYLESDRALAKCLQEDEEKRSKRANPRKELHAMKETMLGKSILLVEHIIQTISSYSTAYDTLNAIDIKPVVKDDMVFLMERMLKTQAEYKSLGHKSHLDTGYHYTSKPNMAHIRTNGLMSQKERLSQKIRVGGHGSAFGDGVYTANNPTCFQSYGELGLLVARLQGASVRVAPFPQPFIKGEDVNDATTIVGNKTVRNGQWPKLDDYDEVVLKSSFQCVPMIQFNRLNTMKRSDHQLILHLQTVIQRMLNECLNDYGSVFTKSRIDVDQFSVSHSSGPSAHASNQPSRSHQNYDVHRISRAPAPGVPLAPSKVLTTTKETRSHSTGVKRKHSSGGIQLRQRSKKMLTYTAPNSLDADVPKNALIEKQTFS